MEDVSLFRTMLGDTPTIRVLEFLIEGRGLDYSLTDITKNAHVSWSTLHRIWSNLEMMNMVKRTRDVGNARLYKINEANPSVKQLIGLYDTIIFEESERFLSLPGDAKEKLEDVKMPVYEV